jgi:uncharacterized protein YbjT (DUF2867 family)
MTNTLIIGASGTVGSELGKFLRAEGQNTVLATSKTELKAGQVHLNLLTQAGLEAAFAGVDQAFLMAPPGYTNQDQLLIPVIEAAQKHGLKKVVLMTAMGANADPEAPLRKAEIALEQSGLPYNIIRPNWFMQNFNTFWIQGILEQGKIFLPLGQAKGSFIDARDIAAVAARLLLSHDYDNQAFNLTGSEALDHDQVAEILSRVTGKEIAYQEVSPEQMQTSLLQAGLPADYTAFMLMILDFFKQGYAATITPEVEKITGQAPIRFEQYAQDYRTAWL